MKAITLSILTIFFITFSVIGQESENKRSIADIHFEALNSQSDVEFSHETYKLKLDSLILYRSLLFGESRTVYNYILHALESFSNKDYKHTLEICNEILHSSNKLSFTDSVMIYQQMGLLYYEIGDYKNSENYYLKAYKLKLDRGYSIDGIVKWLSAVYLNSDQPEKAIPMIQTSIIQGKGIKKDNFINISAMYYAIGKLDSADYFINLALRETDYDPDEESYMFIYLIKGNIRKDLGDTISAMKYYTKVLGDDLEVPNWYPFIHANINIAEIYLEQGKNDSCEMHLDNFFLCPCLDDETKAWLYDLKADYYKKLGKKEKYYEHIIESNQIKNRVIEHMYNNIANISETNISLIGLIEENFKINEKKNEALQLRNRAYTWFILSLISFLLFLFFFFLYRIRKNKTMFKLREELAQSKIEQMKATEENLKLEVKFQSIDLNNLVTNLAIKREFIDEQKSKLKSLLAKKDDKLKEELRNYLREFNLKNNTDDHLEELQNNIDLYNAQFIHKLKEKYPNLSQNDMEICALHLLNLKTKDIAIIRNVTPKAIQIVRYRIKKKMGLPKEEDLVSHLQMHFASS